MAGGNFADADQRRPAGQRTAGVMEIRKNHEARARGDPARDFIGINLPVVFGAAPEPGNVRAAEPRQRRQDIVRREFDECVIARAKQGKERILIRAAGSAPGYNALRRHMVLRCDGFAKRGIAIATGAIDFQIPDRGLQIAQRNAGNATGGQIEPDGWSRLHPLHVGRMEYAAGQVLRVHKK